MPRLEILERLAHTEVPGGVDRVQARVGIASGVVLVSPAGALGETINLASRLQNVAGIGQVADQFSHSKPRR